MDVWHDHDSRPPMTRTQRAGWALLGVGVLIGLVAMGLDAFTGTDMLAASGYIVTPIIAGAIGLLGYGYKDLVASKKDGE